MLLAAEIHADPDKGMKVEQQGIIQRSDPTNNHVSLPSPVKVPDVICSHGLEVGKYVMM